MRFTFDPVQFILSMLFIIPGVILIGINTNWYVVLGVYLVAVGFGIKVNRR